MKLIRESEIRKSVRQQYGKLAEQAGSQCGCCSPDESALDRVVEMYETGDVMGLPDEVTALSLGCGDPVTLAALKPGQVVLDLGSGGGIDCFLAAKQVGDTGRVIGVDMTPEMLEKARANQVKMGIENVEFRLGEIEHLPVADSSVDVIISNCVINLSPDKGQVFREAFRVLKPGGYIAVSDMMSDKPFPESMLKNMESWAACVSGALTEADYVATIQAAGFGEVAVERVYLENPDVEAELRNAGLADKIEEVLAGKSAVIKSEDGIRVVPVEAVGGTEATKMFSGKVTGRKPIEEYVV